MVSRLETLLIRVRLPLILCLGLILTSLSYTLALGLRFDFDWNEVFLLDRFLLPWSLLLFYRAASYSFFQLNRGYWRYASTQDLIDIIKAHGLSSLFLTATALFLRLEEFPRSVVLIELAISIIFCGGSRLAVRVLGERLVAQQDMEEDTARDVIVIGAGDSGHLIIKNMLSLKRLSYRPVAVLDDSDNLQGVNLYGVKVVGRITNLEEQLEKFPRVSAVIVAIPTISNTRLRSIEAVCKTFGVALKKLQSFEDIACIDASVKHEGVSIEQVLEKKTQIEHEDEIRRELNNRTILITGAGGSIGSEIVRQVCYFDPHKVVLLDSSEYNLFRMERELHTAFERGGKKAEFRCVVANIVDAARLSKIFSSEKPEYVFHAAAYKHVPLMEHNCYEAFRNNVIGTKNVLDASVQFGVRRFVLISSDKAVAPSSIMGCSKLLAELLVQWYSHTQQTTASNHPLATSIVRFGNVINSTGSVIPIFKEQILSGGPVTITHPDMERYFMSIREAVRLVLTAGTLGQKGEIYILDMGRPMKIVDVARKMMALYGRRDIEIEYTGMRPGEKLTEELLTSHELRGPTRFDKVNRVQNFEPPSIDISRWVLEVEQKLPRLSDTEIRDLMFTLANTACPSASPVAQPKTTAKVA